MHKLNAKAVTKALKALGTPAKASASARFFKTQKGQYGYGDKFIGVTVPEQRRIANVFSGLELEEISVLLKSAWHECRLTALFILVAQYAKAEDDKKGRIVRFFIEHKKKINNWDLVDSSAPYILGDYSADKDRSLLYLLARSNNLWERRIAIVTTAALIRKGMYDDTLQIAKLLLQDRDDLIHKAVGWMLREVGKKSFKTEEEFLNDYAAQMPRTMLRYAIEKFPEDKKRKYMAIKPKSSDD